MSEDLSSRKSWVQSFFFVRAMHVVIDTFLASSCFLLAYLLRFEGWPPPVYASRMLTFLPLVVVTRILMNHRMRLYTQVWRYVSIYDARRIVVSASIVSGFLLLIRLFLIPIHQIFKIPIGVIVIDYVLVVLMMLGVRISRRLIYESSAASMAGRSGKVQRVLLAGAGSAGIMTLREITHRPDLGMHVCGFVDDDPEKVGSTIHGAPVLNTTMMLPEVVQKHNIDLVIITIASARRKTVRNILARCEKAGVPVKIIPGLYEILDNRITLSELRPVQIEDLVARDTVNLNSAQEETVEAYRGKRVLVTGAGGSIGSELCMQLLMMEPDTLILLDKDENSIFETELALKRQMNKSKLVPIICDLKVEQRLHQVFQMYRPDVVLHAAAHKHVGLMEFNMCEAVLNNVSGTNNLLNQCSRFGVERCIMVSTDKAVNPSSIMGCTKRVSELLFQRQVSVDSNTRYSCVRFGNVLGSRGSVVPLFREQIKQGGPITVTHPDMVRYFMTIPEAVYLILRAGLLGTRGEIFVLDMGEPVRVMDLARDMIRLSGLTPGEDIEIKVIGPRAGEKLREELVTPEEGISPTEFEKINVANPSNYDFSMLDGWLKLLIHEAHSGNDNAIREIFQKMGIGYRPDKNDSSYLKEMEESAPMPLSIVPNSVQ